jgi:hypothetical protein
MNLMSCLSESGVLVSYGGVSRKPMVVQWQLHFQEADDAWLLAFLLVPVSQGR